MRVTVWDPLRSGDDSNPSGRPSLSQSRNALPHNRRQDQVCQSEFSSPLEPLLLVFRDNRRGFRVATPSETVEPSESDWNENRERMPRMVERENGMVAFRMLEERFSFTVWQESLDLLLSF